MPVSPPLTAVRKLQWCPSQTKPLLISIATIAPALPDNMVLTMATATTVPSPSAEIDAWEPPLKAKKPKNRMNPPRATCWKKWIARVHFMKHDYVIWMIYILYVMIVNSIDLVNDLCIYAGNIVQHLWSNHPIILSLSLLSSSSGTGLEFCLFWFKRL